MKKILLIIFSCLFSVTSFAEDMLWDLDTVVHQAQSYPALNARTTNGTQVTLSKDYINKLDEIRKIIEEMRLAYEPRRAVRTLSSRPPSRYHPSIVLLIFHQIIKWKRV